MQARTRSRIAVCKGSRIHTRIDAALYGSASGRASESGGPFWAGLRGADLARVSGVDDAVFCHNARFIGGAQSLKGAMQMAALAVASDS
jgi:hypothetical protein